MVTAYENKVAHDHWKSDQLAVDSISRIYPSFSDWSISILLKWSRQDIVSTNWLSTYGEYIKQKCGLWLLQ